MYLLIDFREKDLIEQLKKNDKNNIIIETKNLDIGDIIICNDKKEELFIIERKTLQDLAASIRDGRYKEQGYRLTNCGITNHHIIYLIEGDINTYKSSKYGRHISKETIYSTITSLIYKKGFSIYKSLNIIESAEFLIQMTVKLSNISTTPFYKSEITTIDTNKKEEYTEVCKRVKKNNVTPENINEIMISQIPGVSYISAKAIIQKYKNLENLIIAMKSNPDILSDLTITTQEGKNRKLSITCRQNIYNYLLNKITHINI